jgi:molybdopterin molybdotransferase
MVVDSSIQRISRLTPLDAVLALIESRVGAVKPQKSTLESAGRCTLAEEVWASWPVSSIASRDGFAVDAATVADAGPYAPVALPPAMRRVDDGERLPDGTNAILPLDAVLWRGDRAEAVASVGPGEGAWLAGDNVTPGEPLYHAGDRMHAVDIAVLEVAGVEEVTIRAPRIAIVPGGEAKSPGIHAALTALMRVAGQAGGLVTGKPTTLEAALGDAESDAVIGVGGTGSGRRDAAVQMLARLGRVEAHGIAISPGETAAFGFAGERPVLLVPGRLDAALAIWLLIGRSLLAKLGGASVGDPVSETLPLKRKVTSTIGMTEVIPVSCVGGMAEPLASGYLSLTALARSDGWIVVHAESEGFAAGTQVAVRAWP